jgi:hypothetical protein
VALGLLSDVQMLSIRGPLLAAVLGGLVMPACQVGAAQPVDPSHVALQRSDLPADLAPCAISGSIDRYLTVLAVKDSHGYATIHDGWRQLQAAGAVAGAMTVYSSAPQDCEREPGAGAGRSAATLVARFSTDQAAASAYPKGAMGFPTPGSDEEEPGLRQGVATQLGPRSWLLERQVDGPPLDVAYWQDASYTIFFVGVDLDTFEASRALVAVNGRAG